MVEWNPTETVLVEKVMKKKSGDISTLLLKTYTQCMV